MLRRRAKRSQRPVGAEDEHDLAGDEGQPASRLASRRSPPNICKSISSPPIRTVSPISAPPPTPDRRTPPADQPVDASPSRASSPSIRSGRQLTRPRREELLQVDAVTWLLLRVGALRDPVPACHSRVGWPERALNGAGSAQALLGWGTPRGRSGSGRPFPVRRASVFFVICVCISYVVAMTGRSMEMRLARQTWRCCPCCLGREPFWLPMTSPPHLVDSGDSCTGWYGQAAWSGCLA